MHATTTVNSQATAFSVQVGERIRLARDEKGFTQDRLAEEFGFKDRQTISAMETGIRQLSASELVLLSNVLSKPVTFFTDPYLVTETRAFSYRANTTPEAINAFEQRTHKLISANRRFHNLLGEATLPFGSQLKGVSKQTTCKVATLLGEKTANAIGLGVQPATVLREAIESHLKIMVLFVDAPNGISGAACHLPDGDFILINRQEPSFRRNFNLAHELFHILTWAEMPPDRIDLVHKEGGRTQVEKLADAFASGLLMPPEAVSEFWRRSLAINKPHERILNLAKMFRVSGQAMYWRLYNLGLLAESDKQNVALEELSRTDEEETGGRPNAYNFEFVRRLYAVLDNGLVSARKAADLLDADIEELKSLFDVYGVSPPHSL